MGRPALGYRKVLVSLSPEDIKALGKAVESGLAADRSAVVRELVRAWSQDSPTRKAVKAWQDRIQARGREER